MTTPSLRAALACARRYRGIVAAAIVAVACKGSEVTAPKPVPRPPTPTVGVTLSSGSASLTIGATHRISATVTGTSNGAVTWSSSSTSVATVASDGLVTGVGAGTALITATSVADPSRSAAASVTVTPPVAVTLSASTATLTAGTTQQLVATVGGSTNQSVVWRTSAPTVATVAGNGLVTAVAPGAATISATALADTTRVATALVTVVAPLPMAMRVSMDTVRPGYVLHVFVPNQTLPSSVAATLGTASLNFARTNDSTLAALVPEAPAGVVSLQVRIGNRVGQANLTMRPGIAIANPVAEVNRSVDSIARAFASTTAPAAYTAAEWQRSRYVTDSITSELRRTLAAATPAQQLVFARYVAYREAASRGVAASAAPRDVTLPDIGLSVVTDNASCENAFSRTAASGLDAVGKGVGTVAPGAVDDPTSKKFFEGYSFIEYLSQLRDFLVQFFLVPVSCAITSIWEVETPQDQLFENGKEPSTGTYLVGLGRYLTGQDRSDPSIRQKFGHYFDSLDEVIAKLRALPASVRELAGKALPAFADWPTRQDLRQRVRGTVARLVSIEPASVSGALRAAGDEVYLTVTSTAPSETPFTATIAHVDDPSLQVRLNGRVRATQPVAITVSPATLSLAGTGTERTLTATITGAANPGLNWSSNDQRVVTIVGTPVGASATVRAQSPGATTIGVASVQDPTKVTLVPVTVTSGIGITITPPSATLEVGGTLPLTATLTGTNSEGVIWSSRSPTVATVDPALGIVTARTPGTAVIEARPAYDLAQVATATIEVRSSAALTLVTSPSNLTVPRGSSATVGLTATRPAGFSGAIELLFGPPGVPAGISASMPGSIPAGQNVASISFAVGASVAAGSYAVNLRGVAPGFSEASATVTLVVPDNAPPITVAVTPPSLNLQVGNTQQLVASVSGTANTAVTWSSSMPTVATVGASTGLVNGAAPGQATITARSVADPTKIASAIVTVAAGGGVTVTVTPSSSQVEVGRSQQFTASVTGSTNGGVTWSSANPNVASVTPAGIVTGVSSGSAMITATSLADPTKSGTAAVNVVPQSTGVGGASLSLSPGSVSFPVSGPAEAVDMTISVNTGQYRGVWTANPGGTQCNGAGGSSETGTVWTQTVRISRGCVPPVRGSYTLKYVLRPTGAVIGESDLATATLTIILY